MSEAARHRLSRGWTAPNGTRWRVGDVAFGPPLAPAYKWVPLDLGDPRATSRLFAGGGDGWIRAYRLKPGDHDALDDESLAAQLWAAEFLETRPIDELIPGYSPERKAPPAFE